MSTTEKPQIVCLCGSTKLMKTAFVEANRDETLAGKIVLSVGVDMKDESQAFLARMSVAERDSIKKQLDVLHRRKIDMAHEVQILKTVGEELGTSTAAEKDYAERSGKPITIREFPAK